MVDDLKDDHNAKYSAWLDKFRRMNGYIEAINLSEQNGNWELARQNLKNLHREIVPYYQKKEESDFNDLFSILSNSISEMVVAKKLFSAEGRQAFDELVVLVRKVISRKGFDTTLRDGGSTSGVTGFTGR